MEFKQCSFAGFFEDKPKLDMVLANPPYIDPQEKESLQVEVSQFEPHIALFGKKSGLDYPLEILEKTSYLMKDTFAFLMEIGWDQSDFLKNKCNEFGIQNCTFVEDYNRFKRIMIITVEKSL